MFSGVHNYTQYYNYFGVHLQPLQEGHSREGVAWHVTDAVLLQISAEEKVGGAGYLCACATSNSPACIILHTQKVICALAF